ncbi:S8 family serine peptidase [Neobacillus niacini]|uniref:S8 family serine peptidase n=1 Tax=Neobacillus niacini TaxID=86668 RepID=UPI00398386B9
MKKIKKSKKIGRRLSVMALSGVLAMTGAPLMSQPEVSVKAASSLTSKDVLASLTPEQRRAIQEVTASSDSTGIQIPSSVDLTSNKEISILVEFKNHVPKTAIIASKLKGEQLSYSEAKAKVDKEHDTFKEDIEKLNVKATIKGSYKEVFNGVAMTLPASKVQTLLKSNVVKSVWENKIVEFIQPVSSEETNGGPVYSGVHPHGMTGVDKLHEKGLTGTGVKVAVLDTGIDYNHPDLKGAYQGGYDFVDEDGDPMETSYEDWAASGLPQFNGSSPYYTAHGTHVSGIIAGQGESDSPLTVKGVAPDADLYVYRVLGPYGNGTTEDILQGIEAAVKEKMDVINLSLGNILNDPLSPLSAAINNAVIAGVTSVLAAGNAGPGLYSVGSPASSALAITVGSTNTEVSYPHFTGAFRSASLNQDLELRYSTSGLGINLSEWKDITLPIVDVGMGLDADYEGRDVQDKIVLMTTGGTSRIFEKVEIAKKKGAKAVFVYSPYPGFIGDTWIEDPKFIPTYIVEGTTGKKLTQLLKTEEATFTFNAVNKQIITKDDTLSSFSSSGPARLTYDIKPEIVAPGAGILSTVPKYNSQVEDYKDSYAKFSGTSMATPHISGVAALLKQADPKSTPDEIKAALMNTGDDLVPNYSVYDLGAGRVDALEAVEAATRIQVVDQTPHLHNGKEKEIKDLTGALSFGTKFVTGSDIQDEKEVSIENLTNEAKAFKVDVSFNINARGSRDGELNGVKLTAPEKIELKAKGKTTTNVSLLIPDSAQNGIYEGYVTFTNQENEKEVYQVPFAVRKVKEGVDYLEISNTFSTIRENGFGKIANITGRFALNSHMKNIDIFLVDAAQDKEIGFVGNIDGRFVQEGAIVYLNGSFDGNYHPLTENTNQPIAYETKVAPAGAYKLKYVFTDDSGKETIIEKPVLIDNQIPQLKTNITERIIEVDPSQTMVEVSGHIEDQQIQMAKELGIDVTQGSNNVSYKSVNSFPQNLPVGENGDFTLKQFFPSYVKVLPVRLTGSDRAGLDSVQEEFFYVKSGTPYLATVPNRTETKTGESVQFTTSLHHVAPWKELTFSYTYNKEVLDVKGINLVDALKNKAELNIEETSSGMKVTLKSKDGSEIVTDGLFTIDTEVKNDQFFSNYLDIKASGAKITKGDGSTVSVEGISPSLKVWSDTSEITADINGEAVFFRDGFGKLLTTHIDYKKVGAIIKAVDQSGKEYPAEIINDGRFKISGLPSTQEILKLHFDVPGHFSVVKEFQVGRETDYGEQKFVKFFPAWAGDANHDQLIDIRDALYLQEHWGSSDRQGDMNFDGIIDMKDMEYIKNHYLQVNPTIEVKDKPQDKDRGRTLDDILGELR